jgi:hypothetical protein
MSYLQFNEVDNLDHKTRLWHVKNTADQFLGLVKFSGAWRKYIFVPNIQAHCQFDAKCLQDIIYFLNDATQQWRDGL